MSPVPYVFFRLFADAAVRTRSKLRIRVVPDIGPQSGVDYDCGPMSVMSGCLDSHLTRGHRAQWTSPPGR
nr:hypothetical protein [Kibdelosporangium sp. MJ126-NF4]